MDAIKLSKKVLLGVARLAARIILAIVLIVILVLVCLLLPIKGTRIVEDYLESVRMLLSKNPL